MKARETLGLRFVLAVATCVGLAFLATNSSAGGEGQPSGLRPSSGAVASGSLNALNHSEPNLSTNLVVTTKERPPLKLRANLQADGEGIFLEQLVEPGSDLPRLRLCDAPAFGKSVALKHAEIVSLAASAGFDSISTNWTGPEVIRISRRVRPLAEKELLELLTASLQQHYVKELGQLELHTVRPWAPVSVPDEAFAIQVSDLPTSGLSSSLIVRFDV
jgi:hypothetical protein